MSSGVEMEAITGKTPLWNFIVERTYSHPSKGIFAGDKLMNDSETSRLEFASIAAAMRAHSRLCKHHDEPAKHMIEVPEAFIVDPKTGKAPIRAAYDEEGNK